MFASATAARFEITVCRMSAYQEERVKTLNHKSFRTYHELSGAVCVNFAPGIAADIRRENIRADQARQAQAREKSYWQTLRNREGETRHEFVQ